MLVEGILGFFRLYEHPQLPYVLACPSRPEYLQAQLLLDRLDMGVDPGGQVFQRAVMCDQLHKLDCSKSFKTCVSEHKIQIYTGMITGTYALV